MTINTDQIECWTQQLKEINEKLDGLQEVIDKCVNTGSDTVREQIQQVADTACEGISNQANKVRDKIVEMLRKQYQDAMSQSIILQAIVNLNPTDLGSCISGVKQITQLYLGPLTDALLTIQQILQVAPPPLSKKCLS